MILPLLLLAVDPARAAWIMSPPGLAASRPNVHSVETGERTVVVRSSGIALRHLGLLQAPPVPQSEPREFVFEIPRDPEPSAVHSRIPVDIAGVFVNGMPIYNQCETLSYSGQNIWHYDAVANNDDGTLTAAGHPHPSLTHRPVPGLLEQLARSAERPLLGFALDGFPIYGQPVRSSYRLRKLTHRESLPDGTQLTPEQYGPEVSPSDPLGTFAEDYEFIPGSGDLDQFNGKPVDGAYAYFLSTDGAGRLAYPYLIGPRFYGVVPTAPRPMFVPLGTRGNITLSASSTGQTMTFRLEAAGIRHFEYVHERPIHLLIVSEDLADFAHIHPQLNSTGDYEVTHTFPRGGAYKIWADFCLPGEAPRVESWDVFVKGPHTSLKPDEASPLTAQLIAQQPLRTGADIPITLKLSGADEKLEPYLGAWAHVIIVSDDLTNFTHAHPIDNSPAPTHTHLLGPTPSEINIVTSFPKPGVYKMWAQFQRSGQVITLPFLLHVEQGAKKSEPPEVPADAVPVHITQRGYEPSRLEIPANRPLTLAFTRDQSPNCGAEVFFPALGIRRQVPLGGTVLIELPAQPPGELAFSCGMGMFRGIMLAK